MYQRVSTRLLAIGAVALTTMFGLVVVPGSAAAASNTRHIRRGGTAAYQPRPAGSGAPGALSTEIPKGFGPEAGEGGDAVTRRAAGRSFRPDRSLAPRSAQGKSNDSPTTAGTVDGQATTGGVVRNGPRLLNSFDGLNHHDQRTANNGNQF